ncbi:hypothetical protein GGR52DRAFT_592548 [Hypoxylon sp. FL1284]|nr:hypothetical protein GGR52DRAFT_592548 [Hypoxylon sp. FL1284]
MALLIYPVTFVRRPGARRPQGSGAFDSGGSEGSGALRSEGSEGSGALRSEGSEGSGALRSEDSEGSGALRSEEYQCPQPEVSTRYEEKKDEFRTSVRVYVMAQKYGLSDLKDLAKAEMERLGRHIHLAELLDIINGALPAPKAGDKWIRNYVKSRVDLNLGSLQSHLGADESGKAGKTVSMANVVLRAMVELHPENMGLASTSSTETESKDTTKTKGKSKRRAESEGASEVRKTKKMESSQKR